MCVWQITRNFDKIFRRRQKLCMFDLKTSAEKLSARVWRRLQIKKDKPVQLWGKRPCLYSISMDDYRNRKKKKSAGQKTLLVCGGLWARVKHSACVKLNYTSGRSKLIISLTFELSSVDRNSIF